MKKSAILCLAVLSLTSAVYAAAPAYATYQEAVAAGKKSHAAKNFPAMREAYGQARKLSTNTKEKWDAIFFESRACREMKKWDDALKLLDDFIAENPPEDMLGTAKFIKALVFGAKNDCKTAVKLLEEALTCKGLPQYVIDQSRHNLTAYAYRINALDKSLASAKMTLADTRSPQIYIDYAMAFIVQCNFDMKNLEEAEKLCDEYILLMKGDINKAKLLFLKAEMLFRKKSFAEAKKFYEDSIKLSPKDWRASIAKKRIQSLNKAE